MEKLLKKLKKAKQKVAEIKKKIEKKQEEEKSEKWKPQKNDTYWWITSIGEASINTWDDDEIDNGRWQLGNCFQTKKECEFIVILNPEKKPNRQ